MTALIGLVAAMGLLVCLSNWQRGMIVTLLVGFLQDPVRKVLPGQPVWISALVAVFVMATIAGAITRRMSLSFRPIHKWRATLKVPLQLFIATVLFSVLYGLSRTGSLVIAVIGTIAYLSPMPALALGFRAGMNEQFVIRFLQLYVTMTCIFSAGAVLSHYGVKSLVLDQAGAGLYAFAPTGELLKLETGLFRTPETAAWHMATATCFQFILMSVRRRTNFALSTTIAVSGLLFFALLLTGRRKFLAEVVVFLVLSGVLFLYFNRGATKTAATILGALVVGLIIAAGGLEQIVGEQVAPYLARGISARQGGLIRAQQFTTDAFGQVLQHNGVLGAGAGTGTAGAQYYGGGVGIVGGSAEGGWGKMLGELGLPGFLAFLWLAAAIAVYVWHILQYTRHTADARTRFAIGVTALLAGNICIFTVTGPVFGDAFVLLLVGWMLGFLFAVPQLRRAVRANLGSSPSAQRAAYAPRG